MKNFLSVLCLAACLAAQAIAQQTSLLYPTTPKVEQVDDYHGTTVADPYRWLEDDRSAETSDLVKAQNKVTFGYLYQSPTVPN